MRSAHLLDAGAVLPLGASVDAEDTVDTLTARAYTHPAFGGRTVVRLVPGTLGGAEDLTMDFLGFHAPSTVADVGIVRQRALGFPAWALVNDPANGHHALALVKEIEKLARMAGSRIGPAKDGFDALGQKLALAVPHFLPTYYEQAGRAFLAAESASYAAIMFGKAREAERVYALTIEEERQHAVFLEFALGGALTAKALSLHARDLAARSTPLEAFTRFRRLCVERTLGGLPPYAAMHTDLRRLAKAAGLALDEVDEQVLGELLGAPATMKAPESFWTAYRGTLVRLARRDPALRARLLGMTVGNCGDATWLSILEEAGAVEALIDGTSDGAADWLTRFSAHRMRRRYRNARREPALLDLVERMAPRLVADGVAVNLGDGSWIDPDLLDLCLARGVPVTDPENQTSRLSVDDWLTDPADGRRDLLAVAGDPRYRSALASGLEYELRGYGSTRADLTKVRRALAVPGLRLAAEGWLAEFAGNLTGHGLPTLSDQLNRLNALACAEGFAVNPEATRRIVDHPLGPLLGRTLRAGVFDEYGWPALDDAVARATTTPDDATDLRLTPQWPHLLVSRDDSPVVQVVGRDGIELEHHTRIPADQRKWMWRQILRYVDGQLLVCWDRGSDRGGYWSGTPDDVFVVGDHAFDSGDAVSLPLPGGGRTSGARPLHPGDRSAEGYLPVASDGVSYWALKPSDDPETWHELDPRTGTLGRASLPAFFEDGARDGETLLRDRCRLHPAPGAELGPFGGADGLTGWRLRKTADGTLVGEGIDGRTFTLTPDNPVGKELNGALRFPGAAEVVGLARLANWHRQPHIGCLSDGFAIGSYLVGQRRPPFAAGTPVLPPERFWHHMRVRDEAGSAALRAVTDAQAAELVAGAVGLLAAEPVAGAPDPVAELVRRVLPGISHPELVAGVAGIVGVAASQAAMLADYCAILEGREVAGQGGVEPEAGPYLDEDLQSGLTMLIRYCYNRQYSVARFVDWAARVFLGEFPTGPQPAPSGDQDWFDVFGLLPAVLYRAALPTTPEPRRAALVAFAGHCAEVGLLAPGSRMRRVTVVPDDGVALVVGQVLGGDGRRAVVLSTGGEYAELLEFSLDGAFGALPGGRITREQPLADGTVDAAAVAAFAAAYREHGPVTWEPARVDALSTGAGISRAEAAVVLAGVVSDGFEALGLTEAEFSAANNTWSRSGLPLTRALALLVPADPADLWTTGPDVDRLARWAVDRNGVRTPVRDSLIVELAKAGLHFPVPPSELVHGIVNAGTCRWLAAPTEDIAAQSVVVSLARALPWLAHHLPADDPVRAALPGALDRVLALLARPDTTLRCGHIDPKKIPKFAEKLGVTATTTTEGDRIGPLLVEADSGWRGVHLTPAQLTGLDDPALDLVWSEMDAPETVTALRGLLDGRIARVLGGVPVPGDGSVEPRNPAAVVPDLVEEVSAAHGIGTDAATLYLQLLALPNPTDRNITLWNGWKPARSKKARAELAATDLVVEGKRSRAGRSLFLPGGWLELRSPRLPMEAWKTGLLLTDQAGAWFLDMMVPAVPLSELFTVAWQRVRQGDGPRFDELITERRRRP
ncbi:DNA-binding protein [Longispora fulva]|uniref:DNA-binding protein n=1 Tax=Longispora fulva TaxID=619741 RepID=A0A8J7KK98_9ACTN|nr:hypothetical protein [Longispora fulva]MBG6137809.1 hypothetical protein [Longispora fulva]GIG62033.1 DNA-binding protein [Longispora fulva]